MLSLRGKRNNCGPPCELCFSPVLSDKIYRKNRVYHLRCFPCKLCKKNGRCIDIYGVKETCVLHNGYHHHCQPCLGCGKPYTHTDRDRYCSKKCKSSSLVVGIVYVASIRRGTPLPKVIMKMIYRFTYVAKPKKPLFYLCRNTIMMIAKSEERNRLGYDY